MTIFNKPTIEVTLEDLESFIKEKLPENQFLDYKSEINLEQRDDKKKFLADICAFANAYGGFIIIGIPEKNGIPISVDGFNVHDEDQLKLKIQNLILTSLQPVFTNITTHFLKLDNGRSVLIIQIDMSWNGPHRVTLKKTGFYIRQENGNSEMDYYQIRSSFLGKEKILKDAKNFIRERVQMIAAGNDPTNMLKGPKLILHIVPLLSIEGNKQVDISRYRREFKLTQPITPYSNLGKLINLDGLITTGLRDDRLSAYMLLFRNLCVEACDFTNIFLQEQNRRIVFAVGESLVSSINRYYTLLSENEIIGPSILSLNLCNVKGYSIQMPLSMGIIERHPLDRDLVRIETILDEIPGSVDELRVKLDPLFKIFFNAFGMSKNHFYDVVV